MVPKISRVIFLLAALALALTACASTVAQGELPAQTWYVDAARFYRGAHAGLDCNDCHTDIALADIPAKHPNPDRITQDARTLFDYRACERCHPQEYAAYNAGVHADVRSGARQKKLEYPAPTCGHCHRPHYDPAQRPRVELLAAQVGVCGECHPIERETYLQNFHGKAAVHLAEPRAAGCTDCHGGHQVAALTKTEDALAVCQRCHPAATANMAGFLIHAQEKIPAPDARRAAEFTLLFYAKIFFTLLVVGVLGFFYAHTLLWLIRSAHQRMRLDLPGFQKPGRSAGSPATYWRFNIWHRVTHVLLIISMVGLIGSRFPLKFSDAIGARGVIALMGGVGNVGLIHRASAIILGIACVMNLVYVAYLLIVKRQPLFGPDSIVPRWKDFADLWQHAKYFFGRAARPQFDRYTYWEKFDYWAVFWGMAIIGGSGLVLWFPAFFAQFLPGIVINVAYLAHSDEAMLAFGFLLVVHLFNTHLRPERFPLDRVIFTGKITAEEWARDHSLEWERMQSKPEELEEARVH